MPAITLDGQSFSLDGRRLWLVSGTIPYFRTPNQLWPDRLAAASQAGLNCIETPVPWSLHEPRPGAFKFDGDLDLPGFIRLVGKHGMMCILRMGPYIGEGMDLGGLPSWLLPGATGKLRSSAPEFIQPCSKYLAALCDRIRELQASYGRKGGGPIIAVQNEHQWLCGHETQGKAYLTELNRFMREHGITVPILGANNLFYTVEGEIDAWVSSHHLHANMRQLREVRPNQPRIVIGLSMGETATWGRPAPEPLSPRAAIRRLAEVLAAGAQYNLAPFHGGTLPGFTGGRLATAPGAFVATSPAPSAPLNDVGRRTELFNAVRRVNTFASHFGPVLASLEPGYLPAMISLDNAVGARASKRAPGEQAGLVVLERRGAQGSIVFIFGPEIDDGAPRRATVLLGDGSTLPIDLGTQPAMWLLLNSHLVARATLDYCNLSVFGLAKNVLVCSGPPGAVGIMSINGSAFEMIVPEGPAPLVEEHEDMRIVVCNEATIDATYFTSDAVLIGVAGFAADGTPLPHAAYRRITRIGSDGVSKAENAPSAARARPLPSLSDWHFAPTDDFVEGASDRFASIEGPASMQQVGSGAGYGWMRLRFKPAPGKTFKAGAFESADRLHFYLDGEELALIGVGPGADENPFSLPLKGRDHTLTALIDNLGRTSEGNAMGEPKGLFGHIYECCPLRAAAPKLESDDPIDPLAFRSPIFGLQDGDETDGRRITWKLQHRRKTPVVMVIEGLMDPGLVLVNSAPVAVLARGSRQTIVLPPDLLNKAPGAVQIALVGDAEEALRASKEGVRFYECETNLTAKAAWAFAKWEPPAASKFKASRTGASTKGRPAWWKCRFTLDSLDGPVYLEAAGLSKGQLFLNGHNVGRYFVSTRTGKAVPPEQRYYLPEPWFKPGAPNELMIFDEHGCAPDKARLVRA